jgi:hypothetical protein
MADAGGVLVNQTNLNELKYWICGLQEHFARSCISTPSTVIPFNLIIPANTQVHDQETRLCVLSDPTRPNKYCQGPDREGVQAMIVHNTSIPVCFLLQCSGK